MKNVFKVLPLLLLLVACSSSEISSIVPDNRIDYRQSTNENPLEIPPDLTGDSLNDMLADEAKTGVSSLSSYEASQQSGQVRESIFAEHSKNLHRAGNSTWLEVDASSAKVWNLAIKFWQSQNIRLTKKDVAIGVMETPWMQNNSSVPDTFLTRLIGSAVKNVYDSGERDKFRTRLERADKNTTRIYITHYGAEDTPLDNTGREVKDNKVDEAVFQWLPGKRNPDLEDEMLRRLSLYVYRKGQILREADNNSSTKPSIALQSVKGQPALVMTNTNYNTAWIVLGVAADRAGYEIQGQNRNAGDYQIAVVEIEKSAWYSFSDDKKISKEKYRLRIADNGSQQIAIIQSENGGKLSSVLAKAILAKLSESIVI